MRSDTVAVIPTFQPRLSEVRSLFDSLKQQVTGIVIADDASSCTADPILHELAGLGAAVVRHRKNAGIARSLNDGLAYAAAQGAQWLLTLDQDSTIEEGYVQALTDGARAASEVLGSARVGAVAPAGIADASGGLGYPITDLEGVATTEEVIQTGTLWSVEALAAVGGFDERLAMDAVDAAACLRLRQAGLTVVLVADLEVGHRIGNGRQFSILGRSVLSSGHSPARRSTIVRNRLRLFPEEFRQSPLHAFRTLRRVTMQTGLAITVEDDRWAKAKGAARGLMPKGNG